MALKDKGKDTVPAFYEYGIFDPWLSGIRDDAPEWAKKEYEEYLKQKEEDKKTLTKR